MKRSLTPLLSLLLITTLYAGKVDIRIISSNPIDTSLAWSSIAGTVNDLISKGGVWAEILTKPQPQQFGLSLTSAPNPEAYSGILLVFDQNATTGNPELDNKIATAYVDQVIVPALKAGMRVAIIASPYMNDTDTGDYIGSIVLTRLGFYKLGACEAKKPILVSPKHPIFQGVSQLPGGCCLIPLVKDVIALNESLGRTAYCVAIRVTKWSDEMVIMSWRGILSDISTDPNAQKLFENVLLYLAGKLPSKYPKKEFIYETVTTTLNLTTTVTNTVTETVTRTETLTQTLTYTTTKLIINNVTFTNFITTTVFSTLTTTQLVFQTIVNTVTEKVTSLITSTSTVTETLTITNNVTLTNTLTKTLYKTIVNTVTETITKTVTDYTVTIGAFVIGLVIAIAVAAAVTGRGGGEEKGKSLEW
ncbi:hypothetical protein EYM_05520 [Ignicoccus islandicus DSM 13165]|uniref:Uncharacterized protein n=1 Tax=Ignicoccus islandicus DSM 13165 TaxID=940295 RepID=A0A0U3FQI2_9CREN|nr:hypothetical protein [Ignicoccus islandicus]ALU12591.1 hypothetical protein EYM_05520 [Ignicoccus islandicus DSM 13165]